MVFEAASARDRRSANRASAACIASVSTGRSILPDEATKRERTSCVLSAVAADAGSDSRAVKSPSICVGKVRLGCLSRVLDMLESVDMTGDMGEETDEATLVAGVESELLYDKMLSPLKLDA